MMFDLEYNSERERLIIPEYGRHIQKLVNHCIDLEEKEERNTMAKAIINVMGNLQPHLRDVPDFKHKLWDQLHIMADFKLDVDSPYETPSKEELTEKPTKLEYPRSASKYRFYGTNIQTMIDVALTWDEGDMKVALVFTIANHMKKCYLNWNKDTVEDGVILDHLYELSDGQIDIRNTEEDLAESKNLLRKRPSQGGHKGKTTNHKKSRKK
ncbi:DUF4290 domain-containing protein [Tenacibaculum sp. MAR_2009_124]|uniref:DUF4290 domain-containing protein n=1 Tax=Tenacibaculum sp. MAR_2009_124 TaxID=1250059 RepID=UPI000B874A71|nr:DUF4290 domain-containing protein [Tenacibaculum sp. MAR_2009_124]